MFFLHNSNRTERLAEQLAAVITDTGGHNLFEKAIFLVQSREMERMLSQFLADQFGVWGNSKYLLPMQFIEYICNLLEVNLDNSPFDRSILIWRLERLLRDLEESAMEPIRSYLSGEQSEVKRYQLARKIAHLFDQYQMMRPQLIQSWDQGNCFGDGGAENAENAEIWQMHLWRKLREEDKGNHRGEIIRALIKHLSTSKYQHRGELKRIFVFGLHTLPPLFLAVLRTLSIEADIHLFLLTPCRQYWGDMETRKARLHRLPEEEQMGIRLETYHPLLSSLGRQGADFQYLLLEYVEEMQDGPELFVCNGDRGEKLLLQRLQDDLLEGRFEKNPGSIAEGDDSIKIVSCHSRMREAAVVKDYILNWLMEDQDLGLHDIVVMAPDIQLYADIIPALFDDIAHDISDCRKRRDNRYFEIFSQFLGLFFRRYSGPELVSLLEQPEVSSNFSISANDIELIKRWLNHVGISWGLSEEQRRQDGLFEFDSGTWLNGLERMLLGLAAGSREEIDTIVPYLEVEGSEAELLGNLCLFIELIDQSRQSVSKPQTLVQWSGLLHGLCRRLFGDDESSELLNLQETLANLAENYSGYHDQPLSFEVIRQWFEFEAEATSTIGFLRGRLTFCSMLPMRSIPFKNICLLGLNDGEFPKQDRFSPFDLLSLTYKKGDRSQRADDRYQFLEAILATRQKLYISYIGQSIRTNEAIPPAPVVSELIESIEHSYGPISICKHPLQPYNDSYFSDNSELFSYNQYYCRTAQSFKSEPENRSGAWLSEPVDPPPDSDDHLTLAELSSFFINPQRYFIRNILNIRVQSLDELLDDHEPFALDGLERYQISQELVQELNDGKSGQTLLTELQQQQSWPLGYPGRIKFRERCQEIDLFVQRIRTLEIGAPLQKFDFDIAVGQLRLTGSIDNIYNDGLLIYRYSPLKGRDLLLGWLHHLIAGRVLPERVPTRVVATDRSVTFAVKNGGEDDLQVLFDLYRNGCRYPSKLYVDPAFAYCQQVITNRGRGRKPPLKKAVEVLQRQISKGYTNELDILFKDPDARLLLDNEFEQLSNEFLLNICDRAESVGANHG